jgi:hypothetical protein
VIVPDPLIAKYFAGGGDLSKARDLVRGLALKLKGRHGAGLLFGGGGFRLQVTVLTPATKRLLSEILYASKRVSIKNILHDIRLMV